MRGILRLCYVMGLGLLLSSCATPYQKSGITGGYSEKKISDSAYTVTFGGNGFASKDRVYYFWIYRCAELTLQQGYSLYVIRTNPPHAENVQRDATLQPAFFTGNAGGELVKTRGGGGAVIIIPGGSSGGAKWIYSATVLMYKKPLPQEVLWGVDAARTIALLKPYVTSNGTIAPPSHHELFLSTFLAHARISVGDEATVGRAPNAVPATNADGSPMREFDLRTADSIVDTVAATRMIAFHALYRDYVTHIKSVAPTDDVVLEFSILPNGLVQDCRIISSSVKYPAFGDAVAKLVSQTEFGPQNVALTQVKNLRISFAKLSELGT